MTALDEALDGARAALAKKRPSRALAAIEPTLRATAVVDGPGWPGVLDVLAAIAEQGGVDPAIPAVARATAGEPDDAAALYRLGHALVDVRRPELAVAVLARAVVRGDAKAEALAELVTALELQGRNREALAVLDDHGELTAATPLLRYLQAFDAIAIGDLARARAAAPALHAATTDALRFMAARIDRMLARADAMTAAGRLATDDLRGWHYVLTGGVVERGTRHAATWDTPARVKASLESLGVMIEVLGLEVPKLLHYPSDRSSEILAGAAAALLDRPVQVWHGAPEPGLVVVYDARELIPDYRAALLHHRPSQRLYLRAAEHTTEQPTAPDLLGYLYGKNTSPWGPGFTQDVKLIDTSKVPVADLVRGVLDAPATDDAVDHADLRAFLGLLRDLAGDAAPATRLDHGQRERLWVGSPVPRP